MVYSSLIDILLFLLHLSFDLTRLSRRVGFDILTGISHLLVVGIVFSGPGKKTVVAIRMIGYN